MLPEVCLAVNTRQAARLMLNKTREKITALEEHGALPDTQAKMMTNQVETQMRKLKLASMSFDIRKEDVLREVSWLSELSKEAFTEPTKASQEKAYTKGEYLVRQGDVSTRTRPHRATRQP